MGLPKEYFQLCSTLLLAEVPETKKYPRALHNVRTSSESRWMKRVLSEKPSGKRSF